MSTGSWAFCTTGRLEDYISRVDLKGGMWWRGDRRMAHTSRVCPQACNQSTLANDIGAVYNCCIVAPWIVKGHRLIDTDHERHPINHVHPLLLSPASWNATQCYKMFEHTLMLWLVVMWEWVLSTSDWHHRTRVTGICLATKDNRKELHH